MDKRWKRIELVCFCGAAFRWYGAQGESTFLSRLWAREHAPCGFVLKEKRS